MRERRFFKGANVRVRDGQKPTISGYAAVFGDEYDSGWFVETIRSNAFAKVIKEKQDIRCLYNHDANNLLGRTKANTLSVSQDASGLNFDCDLPDTQLGRDVRSSIDRGDLDGCSFSFTVGKQSWREEKDPKDAKRMLLYRDIEEIEQVFDVGPVTFPAYTGTSVDVARSMFPEGIPAEVRSHVPELRDTPDLTGEKEPDGDEPNGNECNCRCESCSGCTMRSAHPAEEKRDEDIAALVTALKEVSRIAALIPELEKKQAIPEPDVPPVMSIEQAKAHIESLRASLSL